jgi:hypothetical protein
MEKLRSPIAMLGTIVLGIVLVLFGILVQLGIVWDKSHAISHKALAAWGLALVAFVAASFLRPQRS